MRYITYSLLAITTCLSLHSCNMKEPVSNEANNKKMEDTLFKSFPTVNYVGVNVVDNEDVTVTLGDKDLYNAEDAKREQVAEEVGRITYHIYNANNYLKKGKVRFVALEDKVPDENEPKKEQDMKLEGLIKK